MREPCSNRSWLNPEHRIDHIQHNPGMRMRRLELLEVYSVPKMFHHFLILRLQFWNMQTKHISSKDTEYSPQTLVHSYRARFRATVKFQRPKTQNLVCFYLHRWHMFFLVLSSFILTVKTKTKNKNKKIKYHQFQYHDTVNIDAS